MEPNIYKASAQRAKAEKLANQLEALTMTSETAARLSPLEWRRMAVFAKVNPPSEETQALAIDAMKAREEARAKAEAWSEEPLVSQFVN
jgi:hypothetical protein